MLLSLIWKLTQYSTEYKNILQIFCPNSERIPSNTNIFGDAILESYLFLIIHLTLILLPWCCTALNLWDWVVKSTCASEEIRSRAVWYENCSHSSGKIMMAQMFYRSWSKVKCFYLSTVGYKISLFISGRKL